MKRNMSLLNREDSQNKLLFTAKDIRNSTPSSFSRWRIYILVLLFLGTFGYFYLWSNLYPVNTKAESGYLILLFFFCNLCVFNN